MIFEFQGDWYCEACAPPRSWVLLATNMMGACSNCGTRIENEGEEVAVACRHCGNELEMLSNDNDKIIMQCAQCQVVTVFSIPDDDETWEDPDEGYDEDEWDDDPDE